MKEQAASIEEYGNVECIKQLRLKVYGNIKNFKNGCS